MFLAFYFTWFYRWLCFEGIYYLLVVPRVGQYIDLKKNNVEMGMKRKEHYLNGYECIYSKNTLKIYLL